MWCLILIPFILQAIVIAIDECYFHLKRGLPRWERIGHPMDTLSVLICIVFVLVIPYSDFALKWLIALTIVSCLLVTKDEFVHKHHCPASEQWLHALLFINHPIMLTAMGLIWPVIQGAKEPTWLVSWLTEPEILRSFLLGQMFLIALFALYQIIYWNFVWKEEAKIAQKSSGKSLTTASINNAFYDTLNEDWYKALNHPVALLRAENKVRNPWIMETIQKSYAEKCAVLDIGCGAGLLANPLAMQGHAVTGIDLSLSSLEVARGFDATKAVSYLQAPAEQLPFPDQHFDVVCAMDLLEHVENPEVVIQEASRVLKPGGLFFFHTFNRNLISWLIVIKGVEWFVKNAPANMHVYPLFIKPSELEMMCGRHALGFEKIHGLRPDFQSRAFWKMLFTRTVSEAFRFVFVPSLATGYVGFARKTEN